MPLDPITLATQTTFAELLQRCLDAEFDELYDERGSFTRKRVKNRMYWYHQRKIEGKVASTYVVLSPTRSLRIASNASPRLNQTSRAARRWCAR
jgi:hypothetical protein